MRFKPPPSQTSNVGWRVEFRTLDIQLTDFENSCLIVLLGLLVNVINHFNLDFIIPIREADTNMQRAHTRSAVLTEKFWFNKNFVQSDEYWNCGLHQSDFKVSRAGENDRKEPEYEEFYVHEILSGKEGTDFVGLFPIIKKFMEIKKFDKKSVDHVTHILDFLNARAKGDVPTGARFIRDLVD